MSYLTVQQFINKHVHIRFKTPYKEKNSKRGYVSHLYFSTENKPILVLQLPNTHTIHIKASDITLLEELGFDLPIKED